MPPASIRESSSGRETNAQTESQCGSTGDPNPLTTVEHVGGPRSSQEHQTPQVRLGSTSHVYDRSVLRQHNNRHHVGVLGDNLSSISCRWVVRRRCPPIASNGPLCRWEASAFAAQKTKVAHLAQRHRSHRTDESVSHQIHRAEEPLDVRASLSPTSKLWTAPTPRPAP